MTTRRPCRLRAFRALLGGTALLAAACAASGQVTVTGITYNAVVNTTNRTAGNITYLNEFRSVSQVSTGSLGDYQFTGPQASNVFFRRNTGVGNPNNATAFYEYSSFTSPTATVFGKGDTSPTFEEVMRSGDLTQGLRNPFANTGGTTSLNSNIERIDFYFSGGYTVQAGDAVVFFDLENQGNFGDGFRIAAYSAVGTVNGFANAPTTYTSTGLLVAADSFGSPVNTPSGANARYIRSTTTNGDNLTSGQTIATVDTNAGALGASDLYLVGILIPFADLGLTVGQTIFGYSLFAGDVAFTTTAQMNNWNNATYYPTNTDSATWGNMDFMGFGAQVSRPVPEPSVYGAALLALGASLLGWRRRRAVRP
jgi:hypothetical protein